MKTRSVLMGGTLLISVAVGSGGPAFAQGGAVAGWVGKGLRTPAAKWFAASAGGYLFSKAADQVWAQFFNGDSNSLEEYLKPFQNMNPRVSLALDDFQRRLRPGMTMEEVENVFKDVARSFDAMDAPPPSTTPAVTLGRLDGPSLFPSVVPRARYSGLHDNPNLVLNPLTGNREPGPPSNAGGLGATRFALGEFLSTAQPPVVNAAEKARGAWSFENTLTSLRGGVGDCYIFRADGLVSELWPDGDEISAVSGTYTAEGRALTIRWASGAVQTGDVEVIDDQHLAYTITAHTGGAGLVGWKIDLARISEPVTTSVVTFRNPTDAPRVVTVRWALMDRTWTQWKSLRVEAGSSAMSTARGGFYCQSRIAPGPADGGTTKAYYLPFNTLTAPAEPRPELGRPYRFVGTGDDFDLAPG